MIDERSVHDGTEHQRKENRRINKPKMEYLNFIFKSNQFYYCTANLSVVISQLQFSKV